MPKSAFKCPNVGFQVEASFPDPPENTTAVYQSVECIACGEVHMINIETGQLFGEDERSWD